MARDYGAGMTIDELIGMQARQIESMSLPNEDFFVSLLDEVRALCAKGYEYYTLMELWGNGESVWMGAGPREVVHVWPSGQIVGKQNDANAGG